MCLVDTPGADLFEQVSEGETLTVRSGSLWRNGTRLAEGVELTEAKLAVALADQRSRVTEALEAFADNTLRHLRDEGELLADGIDFPQLQTRFRDRHAVVVARGPGYKRDLRIVRPYIRNFKPVLLAVDGGADALLEMGLKPHVIVGDFDSVSDAALQCGAELLVHAYADGRAPGADRLTELGLPFATVSAPGISEDIALLLAHDRGAELIVAVGTHFNLVEFMERNRAGMASTFVTRLKVGEALVDAKGVSRLAPAANRHLAARRRRRDGDHRGRGRDPGLTRPAQRDPLARTLDRQLARLLVRRLETKARVRRRSRRARGGTYTLSACSTCAITSPRSRRCSSRSSWGSSSASACRGRDS